MADIRDVAWKWINAGLCTVMGLRTYGIRWDEVESHLDEAQLITADAFVGYRLKNRLLKIAGRNWTVAGEVDGQVLLGFPEQDHWSQTITQTLYRCPRAELDQRTPGWATLDGIRVRRQILDTLRDVELPGRRNATWTWSGALVEDGMLRLEVAWRGVEDDTTHRRTVVFTCPTDALDAMALEQVIEP